MAEVTRTAGLPPHLRALTAARAAHTIKPIIVNTEKNEADSQLAAVAKADLPLQQAQSNSEDTGSLVKTYGIKINPTAAASSIAPTSGPPSSHHKRNGTHNGPITLRKMLDGPNEGKRGNSGRAKRGGGRGYANKVKRDSPWSHTKDIPKGNDGRWETDWDCPDIYRTPSWKSVAGVGEAGGERTNEKDDQLKGWDGGWAPAPLNWDSRPAFRPGQSATLIHDWMAGSDKALGRKTVDFTIPAEDLQDTECDIASRHWVPIAFGKLPPQTFWYEILRREPLPIDEGDLEAARPWWESYVSARSSVLKAHPSPTTQGVDPDESINERLARENDYGSGSHAENRIKTERAKRDAAESQRRKIRAKERRLQQRLVEQRRSHETCQEPFKFKIKLYIRSARPEDMAVICAIYNLHVTQTISTAETQSVDTKQLSERFRNVQRRKLPFLVACECGETIRVPRTQHRRRMEEDVVLPDHVVGFAFADCYSDLHDAYRYSVKAEIYTASTHHMKGVANCLMDKLLACLDPQYIERGGYEVRSEELASAEPERMVQSIIISIPYDEANQQRMQWTSGWLKTKFGFDTVGDLCGVGVKHGKKISLYILQRNTGVMIDLNNPPDVFSEPVENSKDAVGTIHDHSD